MSTRPQPLESAEDRLGYLESFGVQASCEAGKLLVIFDDPTIDVSFDENQVNTNAPQASGPSRVFKERRLERPGARLTIETEDGDRDFIVREYRPDGSGWAVLVLDDA